MTLSALTSHEETLLGKLKNFMAFHNSLSMHSFKPLSKYFFLLKINWCTLYWAALYIFLIPIWLPILGLYRGDSLTYLMLIIAFLEFWHEGHWEPCNEVGTLSLIKCLVGFLLRTFWFYLQCLNLLDHPYWYVIWIF